MNFTDSAQAQVFTATAPAGDGAAVVATPAFSLSDNLTPVKDLKVTCRASLGKDPAPLWTDPPAENKFPVGTTLVVCWASDAAGNRSPALAYTVAVACPQGYAVKDGLCKGEGGGGCALERAGRRRVPALRARAGRTQKNMPHLLPARGTAGLITAPQTLSPPRSTSPARCPSAPPSTTTPPPSPSPASRLGRQRTDLLMRMSRARRRLAKTARPWWCVRMANRPPLLSSPTASPW
jgi:hypothetical protein